MAGTDFSTPVTRNYIDTRPFTLDLSPSQAKHVVLPLIEYLPEDLQQSIRRYMRAEDRFMSLASALLKYQFIHRNARIRWDQVQVSRTPKPHGRPYWDPPLAWHGEGFEGLEFNVSHQAGIVVLVGCRTPTRPVVPAAVETSFDDEEDVEFVVDPDPVPRQNQVSVGVDVACTKEPRRTQDLSTQAKLDTWVDTFAEMFSQKERVAMKSDPYPGTDVSDTSLVKVKWDWQRDKFEAKARRFYTCWALKEAYIKMVGEGLIADWLRELEFINVIPPNPGQRFTAQDAGLQVMFQGTDVTNTIDTVLEGLDDHFILATMLRGINEDTKNTSPVWIKVDIAKDIKSCAEGTCTCLATA